MSTATAQADLMINPLTEMPRDGLSVALSGSRQVVEYVSKSTQAKADIVATQVFLAAMKNIASGIDIFAGGSFILNAEGADTSGDGGTAFGLGARWKFGQNLLAYAQLRMIDMNLGKLDDSPLDANIEGNEGIVGVVMQLKQAGGVAWFGGAELTVIDSLDLKLSDDREAGMERDQSLSLRFGGSMPSGFYFSAALLGEKTITAGFVRRF